MTARERVLAVLHRQVPDRIPRDLSWGLSPAKEAEFQKRTGQSDYWDYFQLDIRLLDFAPTQRSRDFSRYYQELNPDARFTVDEWGARLEKSKYGDSHLVRLISPLRHGMTLEQAETFPLPDFTAPYRHAHFAEAVDAWHARGLAVGGSLTQSIFEKSWAIRGFEETMMDMLTDPEAVECLFDRVTALRIAQAKLMVSAGVDVLMLGDDVGMQTGMLIGLCVWRELLKPRLARIIDAAKVIRPGIPIFYHSCGNATAIIPELIEVGVTVLNPVQPECMDQAAIKRAYGDRLAFWGGVSAQTNLSFGTPAQVKAEVRERIATLGAGGGYLIGPNHFIEPEVPWENILAYIEAVEEYGVYHNG